jgi:hypothetical protein
MEIILFEANKMVNDWIKHVKMYQSSHPGMSYKDAMKGAKHSYKKGCQAGSGVGITAGLLKSLPVLAKFGTDLTKQIIGSPELQNKRSDARIQARTERRRARIERRRR